MISANGASSRITAAWTNNLFSKLDTKNQGYLEKSALESAFSKVSAGKKAGGSASVDDVFARLDGDSDGKVTSDELTSALQTLVGELDSQFNSMRMQRGGKGHGDMPPPPPDEANGVGRAGFTKDELSSQLSEIGATDSKRASLITNIVNNFDTADTDGNGKVSIKEAMTFDKASRSNSAAAESDAASSASASNARGSEASVMMKIMQLMQAYQVFGQDSSQTEQSSTLSTSA